MSDPIAGLKQSQINELISVIVKDLKAEKPGLPLTQLRDIVNQTLLIYLNINRLNIDANPNHRLIPGIGLTAKQVKQLSQFIGDHICVRIKWDEGTGDAVLKIVENHLSEKQLLAV